MTWISCSLRHRMNIFRKAKNDMIAIRNKTASSIAQLSRRVCRSSAVQPLQTKKGIAPSMLMVPARLKHSKYASQLRYEIRRLGAHSSRLSTFTSYGDPQTSQRSSGLGPWPSAYPLKLDPGRLSNHFWRQTRCTHWQEPRHLHTLTSGPSSSPPLQILHSGTSSLGAMPPTGRGLKQASPGAGTSDLAIFPASSGFAGSETEGASGGALGSSSLG